MFLVSVRKYKKPLLVYVFSVVSIFVFLLLLPKYVITYVAVLFLSVPYLFGKGLNLKLKPASILFSIVVTAVIIGIYLLLFYLITKRAVNIEVLSLNLVVTHLIVIAFPEEAFFRGYLQKELGNNIRSIFIVSVLFALGHFLTICLAQGSIGLHCVTALLTFFPSLIMGYLFYKSNSIWGSAIFHFLANLAFISTSGFSIFYQ
ncbi:MAG: CPBP family intramembrane metalloprotease [Candidatus Dadabacteria bacterium]|nr:CPBP family intramembrane metalloprotease [Candidatus Dadabacteria bacterium]NIX15058.1 CPBP family intramembrane metalloprotease [Candidatus Dadabacteria bacterium]NIY21628.1 CPBP family intramembrane metalloprotease [Candidatus Dadabacteria bacterium]